MSNSRKQLLTVTQQYSSAHPQTQLQLVVRSIYPSIMAKLMCSISDDHEPLNVSVGPPLLTVPGSTHCVTVTIIDDDATEPLERFFVQLNTLSDVVVLINSTASVDIESDDSESITFIAIATIILLSYHSSSNSGSAGAARQHSGRG